MRPAALLAGLFLLCAVFLSACARLPPPGKDQPLVIAMLADPLFADEAPASDGMYGFGHEVARFFAERLGATTRFLLLEDMQALEEALEKRKAHLIARFLPIPSSSTYLTSPPLLTTRQIVARRVDSVPLTHQTDLAGREIAVLAGSAQFSTLQGLGLKPPPLLITPAVTNASELLAGLAQGRYALAAVDELSLAMAARQYPDLVEAIDLPGALAYVWQFHPADETLAKAAAELIQSLADSGVLKQLAERYFAHIRRADAQEMREFLQKIRLRLPALRPHFELAQEITGLDWRLIAALAYQESHWDPLATSPTGVRGIMMLTEETADRLGVKNRLDAKESILAGAKYLAMLYEELPPSIKDPDRLWFALAAYNLGRGHLNGARAFAPTLKRDPDLWSDMKEVLPLMSRPEYYSRLKSGRARGGEAVIMVENVRNYYDVLTRIEPRHTPLRGETRTRNAGKKPLTGGR
ncbi:MAG: membrane-bound lytic murein transglycosylase MltF [Rhodocyclaceae bacterium]|nr:membrane-bound lytic murein transglycosylase MltF [Rhodocyclaceae bacterium]